jgi:hypothetical protein
MPRYYFHLVDSRTVVDEGGEDLPNDATAEEVAKEIAARLRQGRPQLRNKNFAILVIKQDGKQVCRVPIDLVS